MAAQGGEDVYASLLLTDAYLPGALVLAHSLRDAGTTKKLAVLVTLDSVSSDVITQLKAVYDYVIPVSRIRNERPGNLQLMNRPDLHSAFTKINLWRQTQFRKIVYADADVVAYRAPDELFDMPHAFSAAPDIGWPDLFNTGVMVLTPNLGDYYALMAMAERGVSFDGADQGLLNMYFRHTFNRLSFTYNVTPSAHYQYVPAYRHFQSAINMVHFIGPDKPWLLGRDKSAGGSPFDEMLARWWAVYDRHYRREVRPGPRQQVPELVQYFVKGEYQPTMRYVVPVGEPPLDASGDLQGQYHRPPPRPSHPDVQHPEQQPRRPEPQPAPLATPSKGPERPHPHPSIPGAPGVPSRSEEDQTWGRQQLGTPHPPTQPETKPAPGPEPAPSWDAQRHPPPPDSKPEAMNFPQTHYEMSSDLAPFVPPERYPTPPRDMWYEVPKEPPTHLKEKPKPIFPWETRRPRPVRVFADQEQQQQQQQFHAPAAEPAPAAPGEMDLASTAAQSPTEPAMPGPPTGRPQTPPRPSHRDIWSSFPRTNAWDDVPEINRYVDALQKHRRARSRGGLGLGLGPGAGRAALEEPESRRRGVRVTDFPSEDDRPSLPVTPAPIRRPRHRRGGGGFGFGGYGEGEGEEQLPAAEGVPAQADWDPLAQLQKLARQQSEALFRRLGGGGGGDEQQDVVGRGGRREIPSRPLPFGSEDARSPTYVASSPRVVSPKPVKPDTGPSPVTRILAAAPEIVPTQQQQQQQQQQQTEESPSAAASRTEARGPAGAVAVAVPSYQGPGPSFEKGEDVPVRETPALPTEEDRDILET